MSDLAEASSSSSRVRTRHADEVEEEDMMEDNSSSSKSKSNKKKKNSGGMKKIDPKKSWPLRPLPIAQDRFIFTQTWDANSPACEALSRVYTKDARPVLAAFKMDLPFEVDEERGDNELAPAALERIQEERREKKLLAMVIDINGGKLVPEALYGDAAVKSIAENADFEDPPKERGFIPAAPKNMRIRTSVPDKAAVTVRTYQLALPVLPSCTHGELFTLVSSMGTKGKVAPALYAQIGSRAIEKGEGGKDFRDRQHHSVLLGARIVDIRNASYIPFQAMLQVPDLGSTTPRTERLTDMDNFFRRLHCKGAMCSLDMDLSDHEHLRMCEDGDCKLDDAEKCKKAHRDRKYRSITVLPQYHGPPLEDEDFTHLLPADDFAGLGDPVARRWACVSVEKELSDYANHERTKRAKQARYYLIPLRLSGVPRNFAEYLVLAHSIQLIEHSKFMNDKSVEGIDMPRLEEGDADKQYVRVSIDVFEAVARLNAKRYRPDRYGAISKHFLQVRLEARYKEIGMESLKRIAQREQGRENPVPIEVRVELYEMALPTSARVSDDATVASNLTYLEQLHSDYMRLALTASNQPLFFNPDDEDVSSVDDTMITDELADLFKNGVSLQDELEALKKGEVSKLASGVGLAARAGKAKAAAAAKKK